MAAVHTITSNTQPPKDMLSPLSCLRRWQDFFIPFVPPPCQEFLPHRPSSGSSQHPRSARTRPNSSHQAQAQHVYPRATRGPEPTIIIIQHLTARLESTTLSPRDVNEVQEKPPV
eukprot:1161976-Pelagomonas_calceolata.AAC.19